MTARHDVGRVRLLARAVWRAVLLALLAGVGGVLCMASATHAAPAMGSYNVNIQVTNGPFSYGGSTFPQFQATLTASNGATLSTCAGTTFVTLTIDSDPSTTWGASSQSAPAPNTCVYGFTDPGDWSRYTTGMRTATVQATVSGQVVATNTVTFSVNKVVTSISCFVNTPAPNYQAGTTLQVAQNVQGPSTTYMPDWTQSKFDVTFSGPQSVTYTNISPDMTPGAGWLYVQAPATPGQYTMTCAFDGYGEYAPSTSGGVGVDISAFHQVGGVALYTNPTTYNPTKSCDILIVFHAAPGGPTPTGRASITIGQNSTSVTDIAADGTLSGHLGPLLQLSPANNQITVDYYGDSYYRWSDANFSFTNPAIPGGGGNSGGGGGGGGGQSGTPRPTGGATATGTTSAATPAAATPAGATGSGSTGSGSSGGSPLLWIVLAVFVLVLGGGGLALFLWARRPTLQLSVPVQTPHPSDWPPPPDAPPF